METAQVSEGVFLVFALGWVVVQYGSFLLLGRWIGQRCTDTKSAPLQSFTKN